MKKCWLVAGVFGLVAAIVYICSTAGYAFPGESAYLIAVWRGLVPVAENPYPFMSLFAKAFGAGNALAPICGIVAVVTFFRLVSAFVAWRVRGDPSARRGSRPGRDRGAACRQGQAFLFRKS